MWALLAASPEIFYKRPKFYLLCSGLRRTLKIQSGMRVMNSHTWWIKWGCRRGLAAAYVERQALLSPACYRFLSTRSCTRSLSSWPGWMVIKKISTEQVQSLNRRVSWPEWNQDSLVVLGQEAFVMFIFSFLLLSIFLFFSLGTFEKSVYQWSGEKKVKVKVAQSCLTLCEPLGYTVHGILQARILEWVTFPFSRGSSQPRDRTQVSLIAGGFFTSWATREALIW